MIAGLLLAGGESRRFGSNKLLADLAGRPVVRWSADALAHAVDTLLVVVPPASASLRAALDGVSSQYVENVGVPEGMAGSIRAGGQPTIDPQVVRRVVEVWRAARGTTRAVTTAYADGRGHPTLFAAALFPALLALEGDRGARDLLASLGNQVAVVDVDGARPADVDTPEALEALARDVARSSRVEES